MGFSSKVWSNSVFGHLFHSICVWIKRVDVQDIFCGGVHVKENVDIKDILCISNFLLIWIAVGAKLLQRCK